MYFLYQNPVWGGPQKCQKKTPRVQVLRHNVFLADQIPTNHVKTTKLGHFIQIFNDFLSIFIDILLIYSKNFIIIPILVLEPSTFRGHFGGLKATFYRFVTITIYKSYLQISIKYTYDVYITYKIISIIQIYLSHTYDV